VSVTTEPALPPLAEERARAAASLRERGIDFALLSTPPNVTYASGFEAPLLLGPIVEIVGWIPPALALLAGADGSGWLIVPDAYAAGAQAGSWLEHVESYGSLGHFEPVDPLASFCETLRSVLRAAGLAGSPAVLGVEPTLPALVQGLLEEEFPALELRDASPALEAARWTKTPREIELLRAAIRVADAAQNRLRELAVTAVGTSDVDVWIELMRAMELQVGRHLIVTGELVTGPRTSRIAPGGPVGRRIDPGDAGLLDISPRVDGYWADCTNVVVFGAEPSDEQRRYFAAARESCEAAADTLRPGARCSDAAEAVRVTLERHGFPVAHYTGHQLGTSVNERPRLATYDDSIVEPGMVFAIEPGVYAGEGGTVGARAEKVVLVTERGPELLSRFEWGI